MAFDFEMGLKELSEIVTQMERETLALDKLMTAYQRGHVLASACQEALDKAQAILVEIEHVDQD